MVLTSLCLRYLLMLRALAMGCQVIALVAAYAIARVPVPWMPITVVMIVLGVITWRSWQQVSGGQAVSEAVVVGQLCVDIVALAILLYFTGGSWNPFVSLFLLPVTVAAATLRPAYTWFIVICAAACYTLLMFHHEQTLHWGHGDAHFALHLWGMWLGFLLSAGIVAFFVARIGATLREHDRELATARQMSALGAMAAGAAHELGTPLATMAVVAREIELQLADRPELVDELGLLRGQLDRCKGILGRMATQAGQAPAAAGAPAQLDQYLAGVIAEWQSQRPEARLSLTLDGARPAPRIVVDSTLTQALINILNNAADASPHDVAVRAHWDESEMTMQIRDSGPGIAGAVRDGLGKAFVTSKPQGMGLGLFLARTTLGRLGGEVRLDDRRDGTGAQAEIRLPLTELLA